MPLKKLKRNDMLLVILAVFTVFIIGLLCKTEPDMIQLDMPMAFNDGWSVETDESQNMVVFRREISEDMSGRVVGFFVYDSFVDATVDGKSVYHFGETHKFLKSPASDSRNTEIHRAVLVPHSFGIGHGDSAVDRHIGIYGNFEFVLRFFRIGNGHCDHPAFKEQGQSWESPS